MSKFTNMLIVLVCIQLAMVLFAGIGFDSSVSEAANITDVNQTASIGILGNYSNINGGTFYQFLVNPDSLTSLNLFLTIVGISTVVGVLGIVAGSVFGFKTDFLLFAPLILTLAATAQVFSNLWAFMYSHMGGTFGCVINGAMNASCDTFVRTILAFFVGIPMLYYFFTIIEWWRSPN